METKLRFGTAGMPLVLKGRPLTEGIQYCSDHGLGAFELEWVRGVRVRKSDISKIKQTAEKLDIKLSAHAPYWVNCASPIEVKQETSFRNLWQSVKMANTLGVKIVVFHPGFYQDLQKKEALNNTLELLKQVQEKMLDDNINVFLGAETTGKKTQVGNLDEVLWLSKKLKKLKPVIDFAHIHARNNGMIKTKQDYENIIDKIKEKLGIKALDGMHCHFSGIQYTDKGERRHLPITGNKPDFRQLAELLVEKNYKFTIICESPLLERDALRMKQMVERLRK